MNGIGRNVVLVGLVSLFTDLSSQMVFPLIPLYVTSVLAAPVLAVGLIEGAASSIAALLKVVSGYWSDRVGRRKPFILVGYSISGFAKPLFAFAGGWGQVLAIRSFERLGKGLRNAPRDALVADSSDAASRGKAFGIQRSLDGLGSVLGALMAALLMSLPLGSAEATYRTAFLVSIVPALFATVAILLIREPPRSTPQPERTPEPRASFRELPTELRRFIIAASLFAFGHVGYAFLLLRSKAAGLDDRQAILLYAGFYVVYTLSSTPIGALSDRIGRKRCLQVGYGLFAVICLVLCFAGGLPSVIAAFAAYGVFYAIIDGGQKAFVVDLCPKHLKGTALGAFNTAIGLVALPGGLVAGWLWDTFGFPAAFLFAGGMAIPALFLLSRVESGPVLPEPDPAQS